MLRIALYSRSSSDLINHHPRRSCEEWPAAGSVDTEIRCFMKPEVGHAEARVQSEFKVEAVRLVVSAA